VQQGERSDLIPDALVRLMPVERDVREGFEEPFAGGPVCGPVGIAVIQAVERVSCSRKVPPNPKLWEGQHPQRHA